MDPIANMFSTIKNNMAAGNEQAIVPHSKIKVDILNILEKKNIISGYEILEEKTRKMVKILIRKNQTLCHLKRISKPGRRVFIKSSDIKAPLSGLGFVIVSTSKGILTGSEARKIGVGGELICEVW